jgi:hypothetical protein
MSDAVAARTSAPADAKATFVDICRNFFLFTQTVNDT